jgi:hypothetical protein
MVVGMTSETGKCTSHLPEAHRGGKPLVGDKERALPENKNRCAHEFIGT